jgi:OFA family oxalate/formate antiporter-like MFS transporter
MVPLTVVSKWFRKDISKANAVFYLGMGLGGALVPVVVFLIDKLGWQNTFMFSAIGFVSLGIPLAFVFRPRPEPYGLVPDGRPSMPDKGSQTAPHSDFGTRIKDAVRMRAFWHLAIVTLFQTAFLAPLQTFTLPYLSSLGWERTLAAGLMTVYTTISLIFRIPFGYLGDRLRKSNVVALSVAFQTAGLLIFSLMGIDTPFWMITVFAIAYGIGIAGIMSLRVPILVEYFGNRNLGSILGLTSLFVTVSGVVAPPLAGWVWDNYHDYKPFWLGGVVFGVIALIAILTIPLPPGRTKPVFNIPSTSGY